TQSGASGRGTVDSLPGDTDTEVRPLMFNYFGSKYTLANTYQPPKHDVIVEPFAGSAQYAMHWMRERSDITCVLYDSDPVVIESWNRMLAATPEEIMEWSVNVGDQVNDYVDVANYGGHPNRIVNDRIARDFRNSQPKWARTRAAVGERVTIIEGDYTQAPDIEVTWFIDPPYVDAGHRYRHGNTGIDYEALAEWALTRRGQTIVTEAGSADWLPFAHHKTQHSNLGLTGSHELVWYSHPEPTLLDLIS
ncbi:hypothetical protein LCGC14_2197200, partial [marine sediment metagenome]